MKQVVASCPACLGEQRFLFIDGKPFRFIPVLPPATQSVPIYQTGRVG